MVGHGCGVGSAHNKATYLLLANGNISNELNDIVRGKRRPYDGLCGWMRNVIFIHDRSHVSRLSAIGLTDGPLSLTHCNSILFILFTFTCTGVGSVSKQDWQIICCLAPVSPIWRARGWYFGFLYSCLSNFSQVDLHDGTHVALANLRLSIIESTLCWLRFLEKCMFVDSWTIYIWVLCIVFIVECEVVNMIWRCELVFQKHVSLWCLVFDPHYTHQI